MAKQDFFSLSDSFNKSVFSPVEKLNVSSEDVKNDDKIRSQLYGERTRGGK